MEVPLTPFPLTGAFSKELELIFRHIWWNAGYFGCIHSVRSKLPKATTKQAELTNNFVAGAIGGTVGTLINTPFVFPLTFNLTNPRM
jgi:solute carrier family 25 2-oxodicarboxylate transporter 21